MTNPEHTVRTNTNGKRLAAQRRHHERAMDETVRDAPAVKRATHTPGPWKTHKQQTPGSSWHSTTHIIAGDDARTDPCVAHIAGTCEQDAANARLIAAAPDMLDALRYAEGTFGCDCDVARGGDKVCVGCLIRAAIAKATGA